MTLEDLRCLLAVEKSGSFSAAARRLGCSQPAVSQHVQRLEGEIGLRLFERHSREARVTPAGEMLVRAARDSLDTLQRVLDQLARVRDGEGGSLVITTGGTTVKHFMRRTVTRFRRAHPEVRMQFRGAMSTAECIEMLQHDPVDLAFVTQGKAIDGIQQLPVLELDYMLLTPADHPLAEHARVTLRQLDGLECIGLVEGRTSRSQLWDALSRHGVAPATSMTVCDWDTAIELVDLGLGSTIVPSWHALDAAAHGAVAAVPIAGLEPIRVGWAMRKAHEPLPATRAFMALLEEDLRARGAQPGVRLLVE